MAFIQRGGMLRIEQLGITSLTCHSKKKKDVIVITCSFACGWKECLPGAWYRILLEGNLIRNRASLHWFTCYYYYIAVLIIILFLLLFYYLLLFVDIRHILLFLYVLVTVQILLLWLILVLLLFIFIIY